MTFKKQENTYEISHERKTSQTPMNFKMAIPYDI